MTIRSTVCASLGLVIVAAACAPRVMVSLPAGTGTADPTALERYAQATERCRGVDTWSAELRVAGTVRNRNLRLRVLAGTTAQGRLRLEGVAPFGAPVFVLVASGQTASLLLPRERRVLQGVPTGELLDALIGLDLAAEDLHGVLTTCGGQTGVPADGMRVANGWQTVQVGAGHTVFLRENGGGIRVAAARLGGLTVGYVPTSRGAPPEIRLIGGAAPGGAVRLVLTPSQVEQNTPIPAEAFTLDVPPDTTPMTLQELRSWVPG